MKHSLIAFVLAGALLAGGCATKKFVQQTVDPVQSKLDQVASQTQKQGETLNKVSQDVERHDTEISSNREKAESADTKAGEAINKTNALGQKTEHDLSELRQKIADLDSYHAGPQTAVYFGFNRDNLTAEATGKLDQLAAQEGSFKRFFITVEGHADRIGTAEYNLALSRRRAEKVVQYLVAKHNVPVYRIFIIGLGEMKPAVEGTGSKVRAQNRRVEVVIYTADTAAGQ